MEFYLKYEPVFTVQTPTFELLKQIPLMARENAYISSVQIILKQICQVEQTSCTLKVFIPHHWTSLDIVDGEAAYAYSDMKLLQLLK